MRTRAVYASTWIGVRHMLTRPRVLGICALGAIAFAQYLPRGLYRQQYPMMFKSTVHGASGQYDPLSCTAELALKLFEAGTLSAESLATECLDQIERHNNAGLNLRAVIDVAPREQVLERARLLDRERETGHVRGALHGITLLVKDTIATDPSLGMRTTAGSWALVDSKPAANADVVQKLLDAGMIIVGKASLTEFNNYKGSGLRDGWSPVNGQTISAYVPGGIAPGDKPMGHSSPTGSSTGSAVGVSAGFALLSLGVESDGSVVSPASRASLYGLKPTIGSVSLQGVISASLSHDAVGAMARSPNDLRVITEALLNSTSEGHPLRESGFSDLRAGFVDEKKWHLPHFLCEPNQDALDQMRSSYREAIQTLEARGAYVKYPVALPAAEELWPYLGDITKYEFQVGLNDYLESLSFSKVHSLAELVQWNKDHAQQELPPDYPSQSSLEDSLHNNITAEENRQNIEKVGQLSREALDELFVRDKLDAIFSLTDSPLSSVAAASGYPIGTMPLGVLELNGRPFGLSVIGPAHGEGAILGIMEAWATLYKRHTPPALRTVDQTSKLA